MKTLTAFLIAAALSIAVAVSYGMKGHGKGADMGEIAAASGMVRSLDTVVTCSTEGRTSTEEGSMMALLGDDGIVLGLEDEATAGLNVPVGSKGGRFTAGPLTVPTGEKFGDLDIIGLRGEIDCGTVMLEYTFRALDVECTVRGIGAVK